VDKNRDVAPEVGCDKLGCGCAAYHQGEGVDQRHPEATAWFRRRRSNKETRIHSRSQCSLGHAYHQWVRRGSEPGRLQSSTESESEQDDEDELAERTHGR
jgi:hypothetical protein